MYTGKSCDVLIMIQMAQENTTTGRTVNDMKQDLISEVNDGTIAVLVDEQVNQASATKVYTV